MFIFVDRFLFRNLHVSLSREKKEKFYAGQYDCLQRVKLIILFCFILLSFVGYWLHTYYCSSH